MHLCQSVPNDSYKCPCHHFSCAGGGSLHHYSKIGVADGIWLIWSWGCRLTGSLGDRASGGLPLGVHCVYMDCWHFSTLTRCTTMTPAPTPFLSSSSPPLFISHSLWEIVLSLLYNIYLETAKTLVLTTSCTYVTYTLINYISWSFCANVNANEEKMGIIFAYFIKSYILHVSNLYWDNIPFFLIAFIFGFGFWHNIKYHMSVQDFQYLPDKVYNCFFRYLF